MLCAVLLFTIFFKLAGVWLSEYSSYKVKNEARGLAFMSYEFLGVLVHLDI